jgi:hypothetical protein
MHQRGSLAAPPRLARQAGMKVVRILSVRPTERFRHSNGKTVFEFGHLISVTIRTALVSGNSKLNVYDPNMMNITIRQKIYCMYQYPIREFSMRKKNYMYLYPQYLSVSDLFSSLAAGVSLQPQRGPLSYSSSLSSSPIPELSAARTAAADRHPPDFGPISVDLGWEKWGESFPASL